MSEKLVPEHGSSGFQVFTQPIAFICISCLALEALIYDHADLCSQPLTLNIILSYILFHLILMLLWLFCSWRNLPKVRCLSELRCNLISPASSTPSSWIMHRPTTHEKQGLVRMFLMQWTLEIALIKARIQRCRAGVGWGNNVFMENCSLSVKFKWALHVLPFLLWGRSLNSCSRALETIL